MKNGEKTFFLFLMLGLFFGIVRSKSVDEKKERQRERGIFKKGRVSVLYSSVEQS